MQRLLLLLFVLLAAAAGAPQLADSQDFGQRLAGLEEGRSARVGDAVVVSTRDVTVSAIVLDDNSDMAPAPVQLSLRDIEPSASSGAIYRRFSLQPRAVSYWPNAPPTGV